MDSIIYELRANSVTEKDIEFIIEKLKDKMSGENLDIELEALGYDKIFTIDYDDNDTLDYDDFDDDLHSKVIE